MADMADLSDLSCEFCLRLGRSNPNRPWFDFFELGGSESFVVVAALGALTPGHIMIVSRRHVERLADLALAELIEVDDVAGEWLSKLVDNWGCSVFFFEHGGRSETGERACIAHAHLQMLPLPYSPSERLELYGHELVQGATAQRRF